MSRPIKELLHTFMQPSEHWQIQLVQQWHAIFGDLSRHITCQKIEHTIITLGVYDSCWMQELYALTPTFLPPIKAPLNPRKINQIRLKKVMPPIKNQCRSLAKRHSYYQIEYY